MKMLKVKYTEKSRKPGFETVYNEKIAKIFEARGQVEILGEAKAAPPPPKKDKKERDAMIKEAVKRGLASKEDLVALSDSEIADLLKDEE